MAACEKCWDAAIWLAQVHGTSAADEYQLMTAENDDNPDHQEEE